MWLAEAQDSPKLSSFDTLTRRESEMSDCTKVDPTNGQKYYNTAEEMSEIQSGRALRFIMRRGLLAKFEEEDAAGQR